MSDVPMTRGLTRRGPVLPTGTVSGWSKSSPPHGTTAGWRRLKLHPRHLRSGRLVQGVPDRGENAFGMSISGCAGRRG